MNVQFLVSLLRVIEAVCVCWLIVFAALGVVGWVDIAVGHKSVYAILNEGIKSHPICPPYISPDCR